MKKLNKWILMFGAVSLLCVPGVFADGVLSGLDHEFEISGDMKVQMQSGSTAMATLKNENVVLVNSQADLPGDLSDARLDVFEGCVEAMGASQLSLCMSDGKGVAKAVKGSTKLTTPSGQVIVLKEGEEYQIIVADEGVAEATAAGGLTGDPVGGFAPVDSTNLRDNPASP